MSLAITIPPQPAEGFALLKALTQRYLERQQLSGGAVAPLIDLSVGNPDVLPAAYWQERLIHHIKDPNMHGYAEFSAQTNLALREQFIAYHQRRFEGASSVPLHAEHHVLDLLGSKEGIFYALLAFLKPGETVLLPDPSYSVYQSCAEQAGAHVAYFSCDEQGQPDVSTITPQQLEHARLLVLCSPNNPTGKLLTAHALQRTLAFARRHSLKIILDRAYAELINAPASPTLQGSGLHLEGAMDCMIELHSLSKSCGLAGWRIGFAVGAQTMIESMKHLKFNSDFGMFLPFQRVATELLGQLECVSTPISARYSQRIVQAVRTFNALGWEVEVPEGGFFLWATLPAHTRLACDVAFTQMLLNETGILVTPGSAFGPAGKGHVRIALVQNEAVLACVFERLARWSSLAKAS